MFSVMNGALHHISALRRFCASSGLGSTQAGNPSHLLNIFMLWMLEGVACLLILPSDDQFGGYHVYCIWYIERST